MNELNSNESRLVLAGGSDAMAHKSLKHHLNMNFTKLPNKGHSLNKGQKPVYQSVRYLESTLYYIVYSHCVGLRSHALK